MFFESLLTSIFFGQTDLCGLKWRKYVFNLAFRANPVEDPVLKSFSSALCHDILCAWRRSPLTGCQSSGGPNSINSAKELWVFWFGDDPNLQGIVSVELKGNGTPYSACIVHNIDVSCFICLLLTSLSKYIVPVE